MYNQVVVQNPAVDAVFRALSDATRRDIVTRVLREEQSVTELAARYEMSFAAVQKHVAVLERARLVTKHRAGREARVRGNVDTLRRATTLLGRMERIWTGRFERIGALVASLEKGTDE
jgi:DNA-binding transcriptional ArsR family regulator